MSSSLATFILLSCHLISSSASSLEEIKLSLKKWCMIKSLAASPIGTTSLVTTELTGYLVLGFYKDTSCGDPAIYLVRPLNTCYPASSSSYATITATSTSYTVGEFSDSLCTISTSDIKTFEYSDGFCSDRYKIYVQATSKVTSSTAMINSR